MTRTPAPVAGAGGPATTMVCDNLTDQLTVEFTSSCAGLAEALRRQERKDTPAHRAAVADWRARIDQLLDMFLETDLAGR